jgi:hypothetical protein
MAFYEHITEFAGKPVADWEPGKPIADPQGTLYRISISWDESEAGKLWTDKFADFLDDPASSQITGIVVGPWEHAGIEGSSERAVETLVSASDRLPNVRAIFLGDITMEESEISWLNQTDVSPLLNAYPQLEHFCVRGGNELSLGSLHHDNLKSLIIETGGMDRQVVQQVVSGQVPALEHLELWLGDSNYGANTTIDDVAPILSGDRFPNLKYLGLCNSELADEIAMAIVNAPILERIEVLDLSGGTLGDAGAAALLAAPAVARLRKLDIHYHYCSEEMAEKLQGLPIEVDASDPQEPDEDDGEEIRYVSVGE